MPVNNLVKKRFKPYRILFSFCLALLFFSNHSVAKTFDELVAVKQIKANVRIVTQGMIVPKQQVVVAVEVMSLLSFERDIKVQYFDVENTVNVQPNQPAKFTIKEIDGLSWFVQNKTINVYPLKEGAFTIAPLKVDLRLLADEQKLSGTIETPAAGFEVTLPEALVGVKNYIVSPALTFKVVKAEKQEAASDGVGSAVSLLYSLSATEQHALMLPTLNIPDILDAQIYRKPEEKRDEFERFKKYNTAILEQSVTLIFADEGKFAVPAQSVLWWDPNSEKLTEKEIPQDIIIIGDGEPDLINIARTLTTLKNMDLTTFDFVQWLYLLLAGGFIGFFTVKIYNNKKTLVNYYHQVNKTQQKQVAKQFIQYVNDRAYQKAMASLYELQSIAADPVSALSTLVDAEHATRLKKLKRLAFNVDATDKAQLFTTQEAQQLLSALLNKQSSPTIIHAFKPSLKPSPKQF